MRTLLVAAVLAAFTAAPRASGAETDYFGSADDGVKVRIDGERTSRQRLVIGGLAGGSLLFGVAGALFHLDSRSASNEISADAGHTGRTYTPEVDQTRTRALRSRTLAIAGYATGGALLVATVVTLIVTEPSAEVVTVGSRASEPPLTVSATPGGAVVGRAWRF